MEVFTLAWVRKTLGSATAVKAMGAGIAGLIARLCMLEQLRDIERIRALQSYVQTVEQVLDVMQAHGASKAELRRVVQELLLARLSAYVDAALLAESQLANRSDGSAARPQAERRSAPAAPGAVRCGRRPGDRKLH